MWAPKHLLEQTVLTIEWFSRQTTFPDPLVEPIIVTYRLRISSNSHRRTTFKLLVHEESEIKTHLLCKEGSLSCQASRVFVASVFKVG